MYETFIAVHDQELILTLEKNRIFRNLKKYKYIFLGMRPVDKIKNMANLIVARDQPVNIEKYKSLCDFTGWYALVKNNLIKTKFVSLIQFDSLILRDFNKKTKSMLKKHPDALMGYQPHPLTAPYFLEDRFCHTMTECVKKYYNIDVHQLVDEAIVRNEDPSWPGATSIFCSVKLLREYIDWCAPMIDELGADPMGGHSIERGIKFFSLINGIKNYYLPSVLQHVFACSHDQNYVPPELKEAFRARFNLFLNAQLPEFNQLSLGQRIRRNLFSIEEHPNGKCVIIRFLGIKIKKRKKI